MVNWSLSLVKIAQVFHKMFVLRRKQQQQIDIEKYAQQNQTSSGNQQMTLRYLIKCFVKVFESVEYFIESSKKGDQRWNGETLLDWHYFAKLRLYTRLWAFVNPIQNILFILPQNHSKSNHKSTNALLINQSKKPFW